MTGLVVLVVSVALVDALNPTTVVPALYLATGPRPVRSVLGFAGGFLAVNVTLGVAILVVGHRLAPHVPRPSQSHLHLAEVVVGLVAVVCAAVLWRRRRSVEAAVARTEHSVSRVAPLAGAILAAVELPTALPYLAAIAALAASHEPLAAQIVLIVVFNLIFLAPVFAIAMVRALAGPRAAGWLEQARLLFVRQAGAVVAILVLVIGVALLVAGAAGLRSP